MNLGDTNSVIIKVRIANHILPKAKETFSTNASCVILSLRHFRSSKIQTCQNLSGFDKLLNVEKKEGYTVTDIQFENNSLKHYRSPFKQIDRNFASCSFKKISTVFIAQIRCYSRSHVRLM